MLLNILVCRTAPTTENYPAHDVNSPEISIPCSSDFSLGYTLDPSDPDAHAAP